MTFLPDDAGFPFCYDENWRIVAAFRADDEHPKEVFVHHNAGLDGVGGSSYIDSIIMRDRDANTVWFDEADSTREERVYYLQNWRHDVSALLTAGGSMIQWIKYSAYGVPFGIPAGDVNADGQVTQDDANLAGTWYLAPHYDVRADLDLDGDIDIDDLTILAAARDAGHAIGRGGLSLDEVGLRKGYAGYEYDVIFTGAGRNLYHVRNRVYDADLGRWTRRDPLGYVDGMSLYAYVMSMPLIAQDPQGLAIYVDGGGAPITATATGGSPCDIGGGDMLAANAGTCGWDERPPPPPPPPGYDPFLICLPAQCLVWNPNCIMVHNASCTANLRTCFSQLLNGLFPGLMVDCFDFCLGLQDPMAMTACIGACITTVPPLGFLALWELIGRFSLCLAEFHSCITFPPSRCCTKWARPIIYRPHPCVPHN